MEGLPPKPGTGASFQEKLHWLVVWSNPSGRPWKLTEIHAGLRDQARAATDRGECLPSISYGYLSEMVNGSRPRPGSDRVESLARFFGVDVNYFYSDAVTATTTTQIQALHDLRDSTLQEIYTRSRQMRPHQRELVLGIIRNLDALEATTRRERD